MSEKLPYEEGMNRQWDDLPVPDSEQSWQQMQLLLDKDNGRRRLLPPVFLKSCAGWTLAALLLTAGIWWMWNRQDDHRSLASEQQSASQQKQAVPSSGSNPTTQPVDRANKQQQENQQQENIKNQQEQTLTHANDQVPATAGTNTGNQKNDIAVTGVTSTNTRQNSATTRQQQQATAINTTAVPAKSKGINKAATRPEVQQPVPVISFDVHPGVNASGRVEAKPVEQSDSRPDKVDKARGTTIQKADPVQTQTVPQPVDSIRKDTAATKAAVAKTTSRLKRLFWSAGIGEQQQISIGGQKSIPYNAYGKKAPLSDYIPSVYLRLQKADQWFVQGEFRYGAPQWVPEFSFSQQTKADNSFSHLTTTILRLKKTYYHQVPVSFNYFILPGWSVGAGGIYSRFYGAVAEEESRSISVQTGAETNSRKMVFVKSFTDSFLYKTQVHALFQTDYQWKRFSLGLRYARDLQPYIRFTRPDGVLADEKNQSLQLILRMRLWQEKE